MIAKLHYITQDNLPLSHAAQVSLALKGGVKWVQFRSKTLSEAQTRTEALVIKELCENYQATFILNDNWQLAIDLELDGVHVGLGDTPIKEIRKHTDFIIGGTANTFEDIKLHYLSNADYVGVGPFRHTNTKSNLSPILGLVGFQQIISSCKKAEIKIPIIAIGGITMKDLPHIIASDIHGIAVASEINQAQDPTKSALGFSSLLTK